MEIIAFLHFKVDGLRSAILTTRKAASESPWPAGGQWQARDIEQHAFKAPAGACATERASVVHGRAASP